MKKYLYTLLLLLSMSTITVSAQLKKDLSPKLRFGITAGFNITQMSYDVNEQVKDHSKNGAGFLIGPSVLFTMPAIGMGIDAGVQFDYRSAKIENLPEGDGKYSDSRLNFTALQIPVNVRYGIEVADEINLFAFVGPQFNFRLNKSKTDVAGADWTPRNTPVSLNFGLGILAMDYMQARVGYNLAFKPAGEFVYNGKVRGNGKAHALQVTVSVFL